MITLEDLARLHWEHANIPYGRSWEFDALNSEKRDEIEAMQEVLKALLSDPGALRMRASGFLRLIVEGNAAWPKNSRY